MNIIAQFIWTLSDVLGVILLLIMVLLFGVLWMLAKIDTRRRRKAFQNDPAMPTASEERRKQ